jgi:putative tryptophan/tyrosine transport system substrate-binding protein
MINRRAALLAPIAGFAVVAGRGARAAERSIGWISPESRETIAPFFQAFRMGLADNMAGRVLPSILDRHVTGGAQAIEPVVRELERAGVALIVAQGAATPVVVKASPSVPVVFGFSGDPVVAGFAQSLARPGGNSTGMTFMSVELMPKRIDFLRMAVPGCRRVALLSNASHPGEELEIAACQAAVERFGVELVVHRVLAGDDVAATVDRALGSDAQALMMLPSGTMVRAAGVTATQCAARKIPLVSGWASIARAGAVMTYGANLEASYRRVAHYVVRVLDGVPPANLPIEQPTHFELVLNRRTAAAIDVALPATLVAQADEIIE